MKKVNNKQSNNVKNSLNNCKTKNCNKNNVKNCNNCNNNVKDSNNIGFDEDSKSFSYDENDDHSFELR
jgi:hypothetical protein